MLQVSCQARQKRLAGQFSINKNELLFIRY